MSCIPISQYDVMGDSFKKYEGKPAHIIAVRTIFKLMEDVTNKSVLDLACGYGFWGRELKRAGASRVVGVDISQKMIALAREESKKNGDDIEFYVGNASEVNFSSCFDFVVAVFLFNYAETREELGNMFKAVAKNLNPGGKLVAYTINPEYKLDKGNFTKYGINILSEELSGEKYKCAVNFDNLTKISFTYYKWPQKEYESVIKRAGFSNFYWKNPMPLDCDISMYPAGFWDIYQNNCVHIALVCEL